MSKVGIGIIGTGGVARLHAKAYKAVENAEIVAVCDVVEGRAEAFAKEYGVKNWFQKSSDLLKMKEVEAVDVPLPHFLHAQIAIEAAEAGKHVAVQKPMAMNLKECEAIVSAAKKANVKLTVEEGEIFLPPVMKAKELIEGGQIGTPVQMMMSRMTGAPDPALIAAYMKRMKETPKSETEKDWRKNVKASGGLDYFDDGWHECAVALFLFGEPEEVYSFMDLKTVGSAEVPMATTWKGKEHGKHGCMNRMRLPNVFIGSEERGPLAQNVEIYGTDGVIWVNTASEGRLLHTAPLVIYKGKYPGELVSYGNLDEKYSTAFKNMKQSWVNAIQEDKKPVFTGEDGVRVMRFILSSYRSAKEDRPVMLDSIGDWDWEEYYGVTA